MKNPKHLPSDPPVNDKLGNSSKDATNDKLKILNAALKGAGFTPIPYYDVYTACMNRNANLQNLTQSAQDYLDQGIIVGTPAPDKCPTTRPGGYTEPNSK